MQSEMMARRWARAAAVGMFATAFLGLAAAGTRPAQSNTSARAPSASNWVPPGMHEAQADVDVGPGQDEAWAASSPSPK